VVVRAYADNVSAKACRVRALNISCGVIITDGTKLLATVPWGHNHQKLDLPKGGLEDHETPAICACRELREETGIVLRPGLLTDLGEFEYQSEKMLHLFRYRTSKLPSLESMHCDSMFISPHGKAVPEAVGFEYVTFDDPRFFFSLRPVLFLVQKNL